MNKVIITPEMIDSLYNMLISPIETDRAMAMGFLNNRDLKNEESEKNVNIITDKFLTETWGETWKKVKAMKSNIIADNLESRINLMMLREKTNKIFEQYENSK